MPWTRVEMTQSAGVVNRKKSVTTKIYGHVDIGHTQSHISMVSQTEYAEDHARKYTTQHKQ